VSFAKPGASYSGTPLGALNAVVLDTETTGLNPQKDRIIEIGAVRIAGGRLESDSHFVRQVNPGISVPEASTRIHGLTDADLAGAPDFPDAFAAFSNWVGDAPVLGFSLGFDLGVLKAEHQRCQLKWTAPRWLDLEHLVRLLGPNLPDYSLETVAVWLGVRIVERHRALADARITAECFLALLPHLRERGIVSLAQAERSCAEIAERADAVISWEEKHWIDRQDTRQLALIDSFPYRHSVADLMSDKPLTCAANTSLRKALEMLMRHKVSSIFYLLKEPDEQGNKTIGICTERDLLRAIDQHGEAGLELAISQVGCAPLISIHQQERLYRAMGLMTHHSLRHLGVIDDSGTLVGAISSRDLLRQRSGDAANLGLRIMQAQNARELGGVWTALTPVTQSLVHEEVDVRDIAALISTELRNLTARACEIALAEMLAEGKGEPPCPFALMVLGSGGRGESLLAMDQDNALVYAPREGTDAQQGAKQDAEKTDAWFAELGGRLADCLNDSGVPYCNGGVMASRQAWRMSLASWRKTVDGWIGRASKEDFLHCDIFFDSAWVYGEKSLVENLMSYARKQASNSHNFLHFLALKCSRFNTGINMFGGIRTKDGRVDCKLNGVMPIFSAARQLALRYRMSAGNTPERLNQAKAFRHHQQKSCDDLVQAHRILLEAILHQQLRDLERGITLSNRVEPTLLTSYQKDELRWALRHVEEVRDLLDAPLF